MKKDKIKYAKGIESEENTMATSYSDVSKALKNALKDSENKKYEFNEQFQGFMNSVSALVDVLNIRKQRDTIKEKDRIALYDAIIQLINCYQTGAYTHKGAEIARAEDFKLYQEYTKNVQEKIDVILNKTVEENSKQNDVINLFKGPLNNVKDAAENFMFDLRKSASQPQIDRYVKEISGIATNADELEYKKEISEGTQKLMHSVLIGATTIADNQLLTPETKEELTRAFRDYVKTYQDNLFNEEKRKAIIVVDDLTVINSASGKLGLAIDEAVKQLSVTNNDNFEYDITFLNKIKDDVQKDVSELTNNLIANRQEARKEELDDMAQREEEKFRQAEDAKAAKQGYIEKGEQQTPEQIALKKIIEEQPNLLAKTPYIDSIYDLLGIDENSLPEGEVTYTTRSRDGKDIEHKRNLRDELRELKQSAMEMAKVTAKYYVKSEGKDAKTEYLNLNQLKEIEAEYDKFYRLSGGFRYAAINSNSLPAESDVLDKVKKVRNESLNIGVNLNKAVNYIETYALKGERDKHKLFSMYEMMGHPNPDLDGNFSAEVANVMNKVTKLNEALNKAKDSEADKAEKKEGKTLRKYVEESVEKIAPALANLTENILPQTFINDGTVDIERDKESVLPFVVEKDIKQLTAAYREAFLAMHEFMTVCNKRMETNKKVEGRKHMEQSEYELYEALTPVYEKVKDKYLLLTYLDKPEPEKEKEKKAEAPKKGAKGQKELTPAEQAQIDTQKIVDELGNELDAYNAQLQKFREKTRAEAEKEAKKEIKEEEKAYKKLQKENKKKKIPTPSRDFNKELALKTEAKYKEKLAKRVDMKEKGKKIHDFYDYVLNCKEMYRTKQLLPQFLLDDPKQPRISTILSMHQKKKDIDYAIEFEKKLTAQPWKDGKRDFSTITNDFKKHRMQLGTDDKIIQFNTKNDYKQFERVTHDTIKGFFCPTVEKIEYTGLINVVNKKTNKFVAYDEEGVRKALKVGIGDTIEFKEGEKVVKIDVARKFGDYLFSHSNPKEEAPNFSDDLKDIFTKDELAHKEVQDYVQKLNENFKFEADGKKKLEFGKLKISEKKEVDVKDLQKKLIKYADKYCKPDDNDKIHITEYDNEKGFDAFFEENGFTKEEVEKSILGDFATAIKRNLKNAGFCKEAKMRDDIPDGYNEGIAKDLVYNLAPGVYPKVTVYEDITLPFYMGQAQPDQLSHVKVARVDNNFNRVLNYKEYDICVIDKKNEKTGKMEEVVAPVIMSPEELKKVRIVKTVEGPLVHSTVKDFRKCAFIGDLPNRNNFANPALFEGKSDSEIEDMISKGLDKGDNSTSPRTVQVRNYQSFNHPSVLQAAADIQVMDYLLGIPKRDVDDIRIDFQATMIDGKIEPEVQGISAADNGKLPFTAKDDSELTKPEDMRIITATMAEKVDRWARGEFYEPELEKFDSLPEECLEKFKKNAQKLDRVIKASKSVEWNDPPINPETGEIIPYSVYDVHKGHIRILDEKQLFKMNMDDLAVARNEAKTEKERDNCKPKNIFDTLAKLPKACNNALIDKTLHHLDVENKSEEYGSYSKGDHTFLGKKSDDKTRDVLTKRFNKYETERLFNKIHRLTPELWIMDKDRSKEYFTHKLFGSSHEYHEVRESVIDLNKLIHDEVQLARKEEMYDAENRQNLSNEDIAAIEKRKGERQKLREKLAAEKGNDKIMRNVPAKEDPLIYYKVQQKAVDTIKKIEDYLDKDATVKSEFGKQRRRTMVSIYNKLNKQLDEYAQLTGDTSYAPKQITLNEKNFTITYSNMYKNRHDFEMALPISVNREYQENTIERRKRDELINDEKEGIKKQLRDERKAYEKAITDKIKNAEAGQDKSLYANVEHDDNNSKEIEIKMKDGTTKKVQDNIKYTEIHMANGTIRKVPVVKEKLKTAKDLIQEKNASIDTSGKTQEEINAEKESNLLHFGGDFTVIDAAAQRQIAREEALEYNNDPKNAKKANKAAPPIVANFYDDMVIADSETMRKENSTYADPNTKKGRNAPNPTFNSKRKVEKAAQAAAQERKAKDTAKKKKADEAYKKAFEKKVKKGRGMS